MTDYCIENDGAGRLEMAAIARSSQANKIASLSAEVERLTAALATTRATLRRWQETGCPDCHGDCASANPPVVSCIMQQTSEALK